MIPINDSSSSSANADDSSYVYVHMPQAHSATTSSKPASVQTSDPPQPPAISGTDEQTSCVRCHDGPGHVHSTTCPRHTHVHSNVHASPTSEPNRDGHDHAPSVDYRIIAPRLSEEAFALHNAILVYKPSLDEALAPARIAAVQQAGRDMGFDLASESLEREKWNVNEWVSEQYSVRRFEERSNNPAHTEK